MGRVGPSPYPPQRLRRPLSSEQDGDHERQLTPQSRPNVLFEAGMAMGRAENRTVLVEVGQLRPFSDVVGRHVVHLDNSTERRQDLALRLQRVGCPVNLSGTRWHRAGDFTVSAMYEDGAETDGAGSSPMSNRLPAIKSRVQAVLGRLHVECGAERDGQPRDLNGDTRAISALRTSLLGLREDLFGVVGDEKIQRLDELIKDAVALSNYRLGAADGMDAESSA